MPDGGPIQFVTPEKPPDLSSLVRPGAGTAFSGRTRETQITFMDPPVPDVRSSLDATGRILSLLSSTFARLSILVRSCIGDARAIQDEFRERNKLPKSAKIPYQPAPVPDAVQAVMRQCVSTIDSLFGEAPAVYALEKFDHATFTGDMRAFKIRLLFLKVRDSLKGSPMYRDFIEGMEDAISESERMAGCKPDNSPRRLSKAEKDRKRRIQERIDAEKRIQPELPLVWPSVHGSESSANEEHGSTGLEDRDIQDTSSSGTDYGDVKRAEDTDGDRGESYQQVINNDGADTTIPEKSTPVYNILKQEAFSHFSETSSESGKKEQDESKIEQGDVYRKKSVDYGKIYSKKNLSGGGPVRKAREYDTVEQILDDIESGAIVRYESSDEIKEDLKAGKISPVDAIMFLAALERYCESDMEFDEYSEDDDLDRDIGDEFGHDEDECDEEDEGDEEDDCEFDDERIGTGETGTSFSYNPRGFLGVGGKDGASFSWDRDDDW